METSATEFEFEGPEKKLEIILSSPQPGLRSNKDGRWDRIVEAANASILSNIYMEHADAYVLSESSLFVWDDRIIMLTCGQTALTNALPEILRIVDEKNVAFVFYERKNFIFPHAQPSDFEDEAAVMRKFFPGKSYMLGPSNHDHFHIFHWGRPNAVPQPDTTLKMLMSGLDPAAGAVFCEKNSGTAAEAAERSGLCHFCRRQARSRGKNEVMTDDYLFSPQGYSINGIFGKNYLTIHITPQPSGSYASFESNIAEEDYSEVMREVISIFRPDKFSLILRTSRENYFSSPYSTVANSLSGYKMTERSLYELDRGYTVTFSNYVGEMKE